MDDTAIKIEHVNKIFKLPHEKQSSLKGTLINFHKRNSGFEQQKALDDITFDIKKGEFFGIVGRNGSGKSTLLKLLAGIYTPSGGSIQVNGKLTPFIELGVGFNPELTGRENVFLNGALLGFGRKEMAAKYQDIVDFAEIERFMDQKLKNYSSGMQVRLAFSIAIRAQTDILLLDEVLAVGDAAFQQKCYNYFEELKKQKKTVVFVSHDMGAVIRFCNKAVYIKNGKLMLEGSPSEVADYYAEENIDRSKEKGTSRNKKSKTYSIDAQIIEQDKDKVVLEVKYKSRTSEKLYIGISILRGGISFAEITTAQDLSISGSGKARYTLNAQILNGGSYEIGSGLFKLDNRELLGAVKNKCQFTIHGNDSTKGAALKLDDTWTIS